MKNVAYHNRNEEALVRKKKRTKAQNLVTFVENDSNDLGKLSLNSKASRITQRTVIQSIKIYTKSFDIFTFSKKINLLIN